MQNVALLYYTIKMIQRFEDRVIWRVYGRFSRTITRDPGDQSIEYILKEYANSEMKGADSDIADSDIAKGTSWQIKRLLHARDFFAGKYTCTPASTCTSASTLYIC